MSFGSISVYFGTVIDLTGYKIEMEYPSVFVLECMFNVIKNSNIFVHVLWGRPKIT